MTNDVRRFCVVDGWERTADRPGKSVGKHEVWQKTLPNGETLHTVISKGHGGYAKGMFLAILKRQLRVTAEEFWIAMDKGRLPTRGRPAEPPPGATRLPHDVVRRLHEQGLRLDEIRGLTAQEAAALLDR